VCSRISKSRWMCHVSSGDVLCSDEFGGPFATAEFDGIAEEVLVIAGRFAWEKRRLAKNDVRELGELLVFGEIWVLLPALAFEPQGAAAGISLRGTDIGYVLRHLLQEVV